MASVPKKVTDRFIRMIPKFQKILQLAKDRDVNESDTVSVLNDIFGDVFGYDKYLEVTSELAIRSTFCDLALKVDEKIQFLVEVKAIGIDLKENHIRQAVDYGANNGVPWVILTNGIDWRLFRIKFEQPINYDLVFAFNLSSLDPYVEKDQEILYAISKEGLNRNAREEYYEKAQSVNKYILGNLILSDSVLDFIRRELKKLSEGLRVDIEEVEQIIKNEVLKREIVEGEEAEAAKSRVNKYYRKSSPRRKQKEASQTQEFISTGSEPELVKSAAEETIPLNPEKNPEKSLK